jgi:16S rRNA (cytidine1402-2'-O)-methyltransferase
MKRIKSNFQESVLYVIATPIGNLKELSPRAIEIFNEVDLICSEDTRTTASLLHNFNISKPFISYHQHNEQEASEKIISLLKENKKIALTSDAGYPGISDPGSILIKHCIDNDIAVSIVNGANAFIPALVGSGLDTTHFYFHGFLSSKESERKKELEQEANRKETMIFYESPHRIEDTIRNMREILGNRLISIAREITKIHEEYIRGTLDEFINFDFSSLKGEMVVVVEGNKEIKLLTDEDIISLIKEEIKEGKSVKDAVKDISKNYSLKKNYVYSLAMSIKN